jgi:hypothetical protein
LDELTPLHFHDREHYILILDVRQLELDAVNEDLVEARRRLRYNDEEG